MKSSWRLDQTYIRVRGKWVYLYPAVGKEDKTLDFMLSERRNGPAETRFFAKALSSNGIPNKIVIDKSGADAVGIRETNRTLKFIGCPTKVKTIKSKYLNNIVEQDYRFIKRQVRHIRGFKFFGLAAASSDDIEAANMIRKR